MANSALERFISALQCPVTHCPLSFLQATEIEEANKAFASGGRLHRDGSPSQVPLTIALGTATRDYIYRIEEDIIWLLPNLALVRPEQVSPGLSAPEKEIVKAYYNDFGWVKQSSGLFNDTAEFTDTRTLAQEYQRTCNARIGRLLGRGQLLLDVACGAIPHQEYLAFSANYEIRLCVDFSIRALSEARAKLGKRGLYILGDITQLPLKDGSVDSVISLHTIYHVPKAEQTKAVDELVRVTKPEGRVIIVYIWASSLAMDAIFMLRGWLGYVRRLGRPAFAPDEQFGSNSEAPPLYFHPQNHDWYVQDVAVRHHARLRVWSAISSTFQSRFVSEGWFGRLILMFVKVLENAFPWLSGRFGQYPMFIIDKPRVP